MSSSVDSSSSVTWPLLLHQSHDLSWMLQVSHIRFCPSEARLWVRNLKVSPSFPQTACIGSAVSASRCAARQPIISSRYPKQMARTWASVQTLDTALQRESRADVRLIYGHSSVMSTEQTSDDRSLTETHAPGRTPAHIHTSLEVSACVADPAGASAGRSRSCFGYNPLFILLLNSDLSVTVKDYSVKRWWEYHGKKNKTCNCNISHTKKEKTTITKILSKLKQK